MMREYFGYVALKSVTRSSTGHGGGRRSDGRATWLEPFAIVVLGIVAAAILVLVAKLISGDSETDTFARKSLLESAPGFPQSYVEGLDDSKGLMRTYSYSD
jgi:hypothetical protein